MKYLISIFCLFVLFSCKMTKDISGKYTERHYGFLFSKTLLELNSDSTFEYSHFFDMMNSRGKGTYKIEKGKVIKLEYSTPEVDTFYYKDSVIKSKPVWVDGKLKIILDTVRFRNYFTHFNYCPKAFIIVRGKIYFTADGRRKIKWNHYSQMPKYVFFGTHWRKRKHFLINLERLN